MSEPGRPCITPIESEQLLSVTHVYLKVVFINGYKVLWFCFSSHLKGTKFSDFVKERIIHCIF